VGHPQESGTTGRFHGIDVLEPGGLVRLSEQSKPSGENQLPKVVQGVKFRLASSSSTRQITPSLRVVGDFREKRAALVHSPPAWRHKPQIDAADVGLSRHKEVRRCCTRCAAWRYWRGSEPLPPLLSFLGLCWEFAWGGAAGTLRIRRLLRALGVMFQRLIPRKSRALYETHFVPRQNWIRAGGHACAGYRPERTKRPRSPRRSSRVRSTRSLPSA
jgi:hypothetical protein